VHQYCIVSALVVQPAPRKLTHGRQLFFITPFRLNFFGVHVSNLNVTLVFSLPEGHWPGDKGANSVCSMLMHALLLPLVQTLKGCRTLHLDCDNCSGQNKNCWVVWLCSFLVVVDVCDEVVLHFMVAGHTKNAADGGFSLMKRALKKADVLTPQDVNRVLSTCSESVTAIPCYDVTWTNWKQLLESVFIGRVPMITKMHTLTFKAGGVVMAQRLTSSVATMHNLLKKDADVTKLKATWRDQAKSLELALPIKSLDELRQGDLSRKQYLEKHVIRPVFANVPGFADRYYSRPLRRPLSRPDLVKVKNRSRVTDLQ